ncbi:MAG TPA: antitoxin [Propionibacteriaceae bacterium]|jgi:Arc/MetJ-type ribon-helix-helix transcriptional regulator|nr:antitoxin [Propionibacteriaceae bacterium]
MKVSLSIPSVDVEFLDSYAHEHGIASRSAAVHRAIALLRTSELGDAYELAWQEWEESGEAEVWEPTAADALPN